MAFLAPALPYLAAAATVASGVMAYQGAQQAAKGSQQAAGLQMQQAEQARRLAGLRAAQTQSQAMATDMQLQEERLSMRRAAAQVQERSIAQAAARGIIAKPFGSLGAIMENSSDMLYEDLEANRIDRIYKSTAYALEMAGIWEESAAFDQNAAARSKLYLTEAKTARTQGWVGLLGTASSAYSIWPTSGAKASG